MGTKHHSGRKEKKRTHRKQIFNYRNKNKKNLRNTLAMSLVDVISYDGGGAFLLVDRLT